MSKIEFGGLIDATCKRYRTLAARNIFRSFQTKFSLVICLTVLKLIGFFIKIDDCWS